jgi:phosphoglucosamine mutase
MRTLFGTDGIRGRAHQYPLDRATMFALGRALAHRLRAVTERPRILLGMDTRESGPEIAEALAAGIGSSGGVARLIGVIPTPGVAYLCRSSDAVAAISISASHNPFHDNGVKVFGHDGMKLSDDLEEQIEEELLAIRTDAAVPSCPLSLSPDLISKYQDFLLSGIREGALAGKKVVIDAGHGAAFQIGPYVFRRAGAKLRVINAEPDGSNINENSGALHPEGLSRAVVGERADFGVAFDGDADRAIFVDDQGKIRDGDEIIYLWAMREKRRGRLRGDRVVTTVMSNFGFEKQLRRNGVELLRAKVGDKYVLEMMLQSGAIIGGEQSGHIIDLMLHTTGDGLHTALVVGELLASESLPFSKLHTFDPMPQVLVNERVASKPALEALPKVQAALSEAEAVISGRGRILVRYSGTENLVRVMVEGDDESLIRHIAEKLRSVLAAEIGKAARPVASGR